ncbi:DUF1653 domain-containing protein [Chitinimonas koreensis]|uniref:DUF1653 domain-containing protein n=1 Tax=Chitinimonas koreensis TaxID=356302 RepID=UPI0003F590E1|nr:DUF1653 domain-containing protein [Chitinimonas koreensis]QNM98006.1 DUF1653 domain-containing protein [Chitinimonas koreensis]
MSESFFRHTDGGFYRFVAHARSADTAGEVVVYEHLWPFEPGLWVRDRAEFEARFAPIDAAAVEAARAGDRAAAQAAVTAAKAARRAAKAG